MDWLAAKPGATKTYGSKKLTRTASTSSVSSFSNAFPAFSSRNSDENSGFLPLQNSSQRSPLRPTDPNSRGESDGKSEDFGNVLPVTGKRQRGEQAGSRTKQRASLTSPLNSAMNELNLNASPVHCDSPTFSEGAVTEKRTQKKTANSKRKTPGRRAKGGARTHVLSKYDAAEIEFLKATIQANERGGYQHGVGAAIVVNLSQSSLAVAQRKAAQNMLEELGFQLQPVGEEFLPCMPSSKLPELKRALSLYDVQIKRQQADLDVPAANLTQEMQLSAGHLDQSHMSAILERDDDDDEEEESMVIHRSARKPARSRMVRSSDEFSPATPVNRQIPRHSINSAATIEDTPSPDDHVSRRGIIAARPRRLNTDSTDTDSNDEGTDDEIHQLTDGLHLTGGSDHVRSACSSRNSLVLGLENLRVQSDINGETPLSEHDVSYRGIDLAALHRSPVEVQMKLRFSLGPSETPGRPSGGPQELFYAATSPIISPTKGHGAARSSNKKLSIESARSLAMSPDQEDEALIRRNRRGLNRTNRMRRSQSLPVNPSTPCADYGPRSQNDGEGFPTSFKTPVQYKQTGLFRSNDWGVSEASNTESIKRLSGRLTGQLCQQATDLFARTSQNGVAGLRRNHTVPARTSNPFDENLHPISLPQTSPLVPLTSPITPVRPGRSFTGEAEQWLFQKTSPTHADSQNREALAKRLGATPDLQRAAKPHGYANLDMSQVSIGSLDLSASNIDSSVLGGSEQERRRTRLQRTRAKMKRMSMARSAKSIEQLPSYSPPVAAKARESRRSSAMGVRRRQSSHASSSAGLFGISAKTFTAIIIGGEYQQCFEGERPVITLSSSNTKRVVRASIVRGSLEIELYIPKDKAYRHITWDEFEIYKVAPVGVLVARSKILPNQRQVCYYIPGDPRRAAVGGHELGFSPPTQHRTRLDDAAGLYTHAEADEETEEEGDDDPSQEIQMEFQDSSVCLMDGLALTQDAFAESEVDADWCQSIVLASVFEYLPQRDLAKCMQVCKAWNLNTSRIAVRQRYDVTDADSVTLELHDASHWTQFMRRFGWGRYLAEGAYKTVYQVADANLAQQVSAVSVMDLDSLWERDEGMVATHELRVSLLVSQLARMSICCNFLRTIDCFRCLYPPHKQLWGSCDDPCPQGDAPGLQSRSKVPKHGREKGDFVYIHMELCEGGDVEEYIRKLPMKSFEIAELPALIFQMLFSMYSSRDILGMRHYDLKLLNFLLARPETTNSLGRQSGYLYHFADQQFWLPFQSDEPRVVKLADFGTAVIDRETLGTELDVDQFTTLENTPIEYLLQGSAARQAYAADTFALGLAVLHLFTGEAPYEELLHDVYCPDYLVQKLQTIWNESDPSFGVIARVVDSLVDDDDDDAIQAGSQSDSPRYTLYHTLYRYLVLFGLPQKEEMADAFPESPVVTLLFKTFADPAKARRANTERDACYRRLETDQQKYSIDRGTCPAMVRARQTMNKLPGAEELLRGMCMFDPSKRMSMHAALQSQLFQQLQCPADIHTMRSRFDVHEFSHYRAQHVDVLPIL